MFFESEICGRQIRDSRTLCSPDERRIVATLPGRLKAPGVVWEPEHFMVVATGDPLRTYMFGHNGQLGFPVTMRIGL